MTVAHVHCDVEQLLVGWIPTVVTARALTELTAELAEQMPIVQAVRVGGPTGAPGFDFPTVDIDCYAVNRTAAKALAYQVNAAVLYELPGFSNLYGTVLTVETISGPSWRPYENTGARRFGATYRLAVHSTS